MRVHADAPEPAELEERLDQIVVSRVEVEPGVDDVPRLGEVGVRLLHRANRVDLREPADRLRLDVDRRRAPGCCRRRSAVRSRSRSRRSARRSRAAAACCSTASRRGARRRRSRRLPSSGGRSVPSSRCRSLRRRWRCRRPPRARRAAGRARSASVSVGLSPVVPATTMPSEPLSTRWRARAWNASKSIDSSSRNGVTIAVRTRPSIPSSYAFGGNAHSRPASSCETHSPFRSG